MSKNRSFTLSLAFKPSIPVKAILFLAAAMALAMVTVLCNPHVVLSQGAGGNVQLYADRVSSDLGSKYLTYYNALIGGSWQASNAYDQTKNYAMQDQTSSLLQRTEANSGGCQGCVDVYWLLVRQGNWTPYRAYTGVWVYSYGFPRGYLHGQLEAFSRTARNDLPASDPIYLQGLTLYKTENPGAQWQTTKVWGLYQVGYWDGRAQGKREYNPNGSNTTRLPVYTDFLMFFRSTMGFDPCDPMSDLALDQSYWGPFGGSLVFAPCR
jgi:hypothetical protein